MHGEPHVAVLGCGGWGRNIVRTIAEIGCLRSVADPTSAARDRARELAPGIATHDDPGPILSDPGVRAVMIATPAETHYAVARRALEADKDVFVEKPLTIDLGEAQELVALAAARRRVLMVGHLLEYHPAIVKLRGLIEAGELGQITYLISNRLNLGKIRTRENALWSFAPHDIAVILRLVGALPCEVVATGGSYVTPNIADVTVMQMLFPSGVRCHVFVSWLHPFKEQRLVVVGTKKMASFDDVRKELVLYDQRVDWHEGEPVPVRGDGVAVDFPDDQPLKEECLHFLECVASRRRPLTDGENGVRVLRLLHAAQHSLVRNGNPVAVDLRAAEEAFPAAAPGSPVVATVPTAVPAPRRGAPAAVVDPA